METNLTPIELESEIILSLNQASEVQRQLDILRKNLDSLIDAAIPDEVKKKIADIKAEFETTIRAAEEALFSRETKAKTLALSLGRTVKGDALQAVYVSGKESWNTKKLTIIAKEIPKILEAYEVGAPFITLRKVATKQE